MDVLAPIQGQPLTRDAGQRRVEQVAKGFESMFFSLLCKEMRGTLEPGTMFGNDEGDVLGGMFDQFLGEHLAQSGALGIAAMVRKQLTKQGTHEQHPQQPAPAAGLRPAGPTQS
ncbi:MAG TPA: rod-binding protein [Gemmataceae bacterium]|nr:rod-binding protein [Gemmataceae bacterium]